ncbi:glycoside hydrolase family 68 protein [Microbacterium sp. cx-59]|uniref:glycoside hydrolase family 68 protein n=1 Tax=Microbacterium sp. cx-59 TaxID=2891207 RepID=UPI001E5CE793|nr:glycoside hydrolase family 68 protein [Microbacterium sp. cx-59]MCC4907716.1 glycoside hydrolase family 68 protein [Microbacterium sp. cx-59]
MLNPADRWVWDFWHVQDGSTHHLFYLQAPRSLGDPHLRHRNATIGHATSKDLVNWTELGTVLRPGGPDAPDATATWTGCVVRADDGQWRMFYTGARFLSPGADGNVEVILVAVSDDLHHWRKDSSVVVRADERWYETLGSSSWPEEAWRDPWVYRGDDGQWHMLVTARARHGDIDGRGVIGHATSDDLHTWNVHPPLTAPGQGFAHLEVVQRATVGERSMVLFSAHSAVISPDRISAGGRTGVWIAPWKNTIDLSEAQNVGASDLYSGRIVSTSDGPRLLGFLLDTDGATPLGISDPEDFDRATIASGSEWTPTSF